MVTRLCKTSSTAITLPEVGADTVWVVGNLRHRFVAGFRSLPGGHGFISVLGFGLDFVDGFVFGLDFVDGFVFGLDFVDGFGLDFGLDFVDGFILRQRFVAGFRSFPGGHGLGGIDAAVIFILYIYTGKKKAISYI